MIIEPDSPIRRLPADLSSKEATFFDSIRYAVDMVDLAHERLVNALFSLAATPENEDASAQQHHFVEPFLDAWSIIDSIHRLRGLFEHVPGLKRKSPRYQLFVRNTQLTSQL